MEIKNKKYKVQIHFAIIIIAFAFFASGNLFAQNGMWYQQSTQDTNYTYNSVYFTNHLIGWICGTHGKIFKTTDGGYNWTQQLTNSYQNQFARITGVPNGTDTGKYVYACGYVANSNPPAGVIQQTTNGGTIWVNNTINYLNFKNLHFINAFTGFVIGGRADSINTGRIYRTTDAGIGIGNHYSSYADASVLRLGTFYGISFINTNTGWITATNSSNTTTLLKTTNMGTNWNLVGAPINGIYINDIKFINELTGFACGGGANGTRAKLLKTTNGGLTWEEKTYFDANAFSCMSWAYYWNGNAYTWRGFVVGENGLVFRTDDLAHTWTQQISPTINNLNGVYFVNDKVGWAVGNNGEIISTWWGGVGVNNISAQVPKDYNIYQNFPNPFNPATTIKFDVLKTGFVKLEVFDQTGRQIDELINENLKPGTYSVSWDAKNKPSGIYYYRLSAADFVKTMKMSLVK
ncbi:MAG: T9SS type A sorting domain-containing protein [Ignavibacteria bacterium]|nr:T9SS type A sorting domain-containing protein [Ignavibacteria bacterium]